MADELARELDLFLASDAIPSSIPIDESQEQTEKRRKLRPSFGHLDEHPQRGPILAALLAGEAATSISKWTNPPIPPWTIRKYYHAIVKPAILRTQHARSLLARSQSPSEQALANIAHLALADLPVLAERKNRQIRIQDRADRLDLIMHERAESMADEVEGGASGLLTRDIKSNQTVYKLDKTLLSELREHEKEMARETGQLVERPTVAVQIVIAGNPVQPVQLRDIPSIDLGIKTS